MRDGLQVVCLRVAPEKQFERHDRVQNVSTELRVNGTREKRISDGYFAREIVKTCGSIS